LRHLGRGRGEGGTSLSYGDENVQVGHSYVPYTHQNKNQHQENQKIKRKYTSTNLFLISCFFTIKAIQLELLSSPKADVSAGFRPSNSSQELQHKCVILVLVRSGLQLLIWGERGRAKELPEEVSPGRGR